MKRLMSILMCSALLFACKDTEPTGPTDKPAPDYKVQGRWVIMNSTLFEFTDSLMYTIYSADGKFGTIKDAIPNPKPWWTKGDSLFIEHGRTSIAKYKMVFRCDGKVLDLKSNASGQYTTLSWYKEGFDMATCP
jgi:hypothetical protein